MGARPKQATRRSRDGLTVCGSRDPLEYFRAFCTTEITTSRGWSVPARTLPNSPAANCLLPAVSQTPTRATAAYDKDSYPEACPVGVVSNSRIPAAATDARTPSARRISGSQVDLAGSTAATVPELLAGELRAGTVWHARSQDALRNAGCAFGLPSWSDHVRRLAALVCGASSGQLVGVGGVGWLYGAASHCEGGLLLGTAASTIDPEEIDAVPIAFAPDPLAGTVRD